MGDLYSETLEVTAKLFGGDPGLLDTNLCEHLDRIADMTSQAGGAACSRQVLAVAVECWRMNNPDKKPYHYNG